MVQPSLDFFWITSSATSGAIPTNRSSKKDVFCKYVNYSTPFQAWNPAIVANSSSEYQVPEGPRVLKLTRLSAPTKNGSTRMSVWRWEMVALLVILSLIHI